jgi:hypothetical protein
MSGKVRVAKHLSQSATENHIITYQTRCVIIIDFAHYSTKLNQLLTNTKVNQIRQVFNTLPIEGLAKTRSEYITGEF